MSVNVKSRGYRATIELRGALLIGSPVERLRNAVSDLLTGGFRSIELDVRRVPYADACGLGAVVDFRRRANHAGATFSIVGASGKLLEIFEMTGLLTPEPETTRRASVAVRPRRRIFSLRAPATHPLKYRVA